MSHKIGITGGIGSGKSVVSRILRNLGIPVYDSDQEAKRLIHSHPDIRKELTALVGDALYATDGILRKDLLASYLFASPEHAESVNSIVHPRVRSDFREWLAAHATAPYIAIESAILYESHLDQDVDQVWLVDAPGNYESGAPPCETEAPENRYSPAWPGSLPTKNCGRKQIKSSATMNPIRYFPKYCPLYRRNRLKTIFLFAEHPIATYFCPIINFNRNKTIISNPKRTSIHHVERNSVHIGKTRTVQTCIQRP